MADKYWKAVRDACLEPDLDMLGASGDLTEVGERVGFIITFTCLGLTLGHCRVSLFQVNQKCPFMSDRWLIFCICGDRWPETARQYRTCNIL